MAQLTLKINGKYHLNIIQAYLPTTSHTDEEVDIVYEDMDNHITNSKAHFNIIMGDFKAKVGLGEPSKSCPGAFGLGTGNSRDSLINFAERYQLKIMNTFFKKSLDRRWTWISPNGAIKNEIDSILTNKPHVFTDVPVINRFNTGSDHCMVCGTLTINIKLERARLTRRQKKPNEEVLSEKAAEFQLLLINKFKALNSKTTENLDNTIVMLLLSL